VSSGVFLDPDKVASICGEMVRGPRLGFLSLEPLRNILLRSSQFRSRKLGPTDWASTRFCRQGGAT